MTLPFINHLIGVDLFLRYRFGRFFIHLGRVRAHRINGDQNKLHDYNNGNGHNNIHGFNLQIKFFFIIEAVKIN